jgi:hypothetical protein
MVWFKATNSNRYFSPELFASPGYDLPIPTSDLPKHLLKHLLICKGRNLILKYAKPTGMGSTGSRFVQAALSNVVTCGQVPCHFATSIFSCVYKIR